MLLGPDISREAPPEEDEDNEAHEHNVGAQRPFGRPAPALNPAHMTYVCHACEVYWRGEQDNITHRRCWNCNSSRHTTRQGEYQNHLHPTNEQRRDVMAAYTQHEQDAMDDGSTGHGEQPQQEER